MKLNRCAIIYTLLVSLVGTSIPALAAPRAAEYNSNAKLTEAHGDVYKRGFKDTQKQIWDEPIRAAVGDNLSEGMQVGTGNKSWAELAWSYITARIWSNSVYAIAPNNRIVYLTGGEMLYHLDKNRRDKSPYYVWTNLLQARVRGTTLLFQATESMSRVTVLEGTVDITNRSDRSTVRLKPGVVYEIRLKTDAESKDRSTAMASPTVSEEIRADNEAAPVMRSPSTLSGGIQMIDPSVLNNVASGNSKSLPVFETSKTISTLSLVNPERILALPILRDFPVALSSLPLVQQAMSTFESQLTRIGSAVADLSENKILDSAFSIVRVPTATSYKVGSNWALPPVATEFFPPSALLGEPSKTRLAALARAGQTVLPDGAPLPNGTGSGLFGASLPFGGGGPNAQLVPGLTSAGGTGALLSPVTGSRGSFSVVPLPGVSGAFGAAGGTAGLINTVNGAVGRVGGIVNGIGGTAGGVVGGVVGGVGGIVGGVTGGGGLGGLGGLGGGLGGLGGGFGF